MYITLVFVKSINAVYVQPVYTRIQEFYPPILGPARAYKDAVYPFDVHNIISVIFILYSISDTQIFPYRCRVALSKLKIS